MPIIKKKTPYVRGISEAEEGSDDLSSFIVLRVITVMSLF